MRRSHHNAARLFGGVALLALIHDPASAQDAAAGSAPMAQKPVTPAPKAATAGTDIDTVETVVVTGMRGSIIKSLQIKKAASVVMDSINATELGRFPDDDVADSLSHINGITINRTTGGEGQYVSVRGLGSQYNIVTLNNRLLATDDDGRDFAFDILPSDVISGADVLKSAEASAIEGSIGGTVNLRTARPFDNPGFHTALRAEHNYNDMSQLGGNKFSGFVSDTSQNGKFGFLLGAVYSDVKTRTDSVNYSTYDPNNPGVWPPPPTSGAAAPAGASPVVALCCISFGSVFDEKERMAFSGTLEWRPTNAVHITADAMYTRLRDPQTAYNQAYYPDFTYDQFGNPEWSNVTVNKGLITSFTANNFTPEVVNNTINRVVNTYLVGLHGTWDVNSRLSVNGDVYRSDASRPEGGTDTFVTAGLVSPTPYNQDTITVSSNHGGLPNIAVTLQPGGVDYATALAAGQLNNQNLWSTHYVGLSGYSIKDAVTGASLDAAYRAEFGVLDRIDFGVSLTNRNKSRRDISNDWTNGSNQYGSFYNTLAGQPTPITFGSMGANVISMTNLPNYMKGAGGSFPTTVVKLNVAALLKGLKTLDGTTNYTAGSGVYDFGLTLPQYNPTNSYDVKETTVTAYAEATFSGERWTGNLGLRLVRTETQASTSVNNILSVTVDDTSNPTNPGVVGYSPATPTTAKGSYFLPLPSVNLNYRLAPGLQLRLGGAEVVARPDLNQLAPTATNNAINQQYLLTYAGNAKLRPIKAWQADVSLEWYYKPKALLSVALFSKWLRDDITTGQVNGVDIGAVGCFNGGACTPLLFDVVKPINGDRATVYGIELGWQHILSNGLGARAQYTHTWSQTTVDGVSAGPENGVSPTTASLGVLYESGPISANVSWDYAGPFRYATYTEVTGWPAISTSSNWVTATASYQITPAIKVYVEGKNLANTIVKTYLNGNTDAIWASGAPIAGTGSSVDAGYAAYGRTFTVGVSARF